MKKLDERELAYSWALPYYFDKDGFLTVSALDPQRYTYIPTEDYWRLVDTNPDIQLLILTEWLDAGWCAAQAILGE